MVDMEKTITITRKQFTEALADAAAYVTTQIAKHDTAFAVVYIHMSAVAAKLAVGQLFEGKMIEDLLDDDEDGGEEN